MRLLLTLHLFFLLWIHLANTYRLNIDATQYPFLSQPNSKPFSWTNGKIGRALAATDLTVISHGGIWFIQNKPAFHVAKKYTKPDHSALCLPTPNGLCRIPHTSNASTDSIVFPTNNLIRSSSIIPKYATSLTFIESMIQRQCTGWNAGVGKKLINETIYDISACDIEHMTRFFVLHGIVQLTSLLSFPCCSNHLFTTDTNLYAIQAPYSLRIHIILLFAALVIFSSALTVLPYLEETDIKR